MAAIGSDLKLAGDFLTSGNLIGIPTETVYGLAGNALDPEVVATIFAIKKRPAFDPLIVHVPSIETAENFVINIPETFQKLAAKFWPGPLTFLLNKKVIIPDLVTAGMETVGIRCPDHPLTLALLRQLDFPLAAPSANPFGYISPTCAAHVFDQLGSDIPYILDGGSCKVGLESTILGYEEGRPTVYRLGGVALELLENEIGTVALKTSSSNPKAPGQLSAHYAPRRKMVLGDISDLIKKSSALAYGVLSFEKDYGVKHQVVLSSKGDLKEAAKNLFAALRYLDTSAIDIIFAEHVPNWGLGMAINDRLMRAAATSN